MIFIDFCSGDMRLQRRCKKVKMTSVGVRRGWGDGAEYLPAWVSFVQG